MNFSVMCVGIHYTVGWEEDGVQKLVSRTVFVSFTVENSFRTGAEERR